MKDTETKIFYPNEEFDLANEYDPTTSTFIPAKGGVYSIIASVEFHPNKFCKFYSITINIRVNGNVVAADNDFFVSTPPDNKNIVTVSTIIQLNCGDKVDVTFESTIDGKIESDHPERTIRFEGARFPSPPTSKC